MTQPEGVRHHARLARHGGTARVAGLLAGHGPAALSCEIDDSLDGAVEVCPPGELAGRVPAGWLAQVHATGDWPTLLEGFAARPAPLAITLHDCGLLTGGCPYPLDCPGLAAGCPDPCPRGFPESGKSWRLKRALVARVRPGLVSPSGWLARQARAAWPGLPVAVVPNGVPAPAEPMDKAVARKLLGLDPGAGVVLFLAHGGLRAGYKGGGLFVPLWERIKAAQPRAVGLVVGGERAERRGDLLLFPYLEGREFEAVLSAADVLAYPSLADNHPLVILEAMARGLPVAASAVGGIPEQVENAASGLLAPPGDEAGLARAVTRLLAEPALGRALALEASRRFARHFTDAALVRGYARVWERLAAGGGLRSSLTQA